MRQSDRLPDLERWNMPHRSVDMRDWEVAVNMARNIYRPDRSRLMDLYDSLAKDAHLGSVMETRVLRVQRSKFKLVDASGKSKPELSTFLETQWFEDALRYITEAEFYGHTLIELGELRKPGDLRNVNRIDPRNVLPYHGLVVRRQGEEVGYQYREAPLNNYFIEVGKRDDLGLLERVAPVAIIKKYALGSWSAFVGAYGIPARWVKSGARDARRIKQLEEVMQNMLSSAYAVIQGDEEFGIAPTPQGDPHKVFDDLISRMNSEISKRVLGQDGTTDNKDASGTFGSLKVLQGVAEDRHQSDKTAVMYVINEELLPRLIAMGYPFKGLRFQWDELRDMAPMELVDAVAKLGLVFDIDPKHVEERTGIKILGARRMPGELGPGEGAPTNDPGKAPEKFAEDIQDSAMNGAQVQSLLELITKVANGEIPESVARPIIRTAFPLVPEERVNEMLTGLEEFRAALLKAGNPTGTGKQAGKKKGEGEEDGGEDAEDEDGDGITAQWPRNSLPSCSVCGGHREVTASAVPGIGIEALEQLLQDVHGGAQWSQAYFEATRDVYTEGLLRNWQNNLDQLDYDAPDHVARTMMEMNLSRFGHDKTLAVVLDLNRYTRESKGFADFKRLVDESGILESYNKRWLATEYSTAVMTGIQSSRWYELQRSADALPYGEYWTQGDDQVRPPHARLNGKRWPLDHGIWARIYPPNGHGCRCTVLPSADGPDEMELEEQTKEALGQLDVSGELDRMKKSGFDRNRAVTGEVFDLNKSYKAQLESTSGKAPAYGVRDSYGREDMDWDRISSTPLPDIISTTPTPDDARQWFSRNANDRRVVVMKDYAGRPIQLTDKVLEKKLTKDANRAELVDQLPAALARPDEVWLDEKGTLVFLKFTSKGMVRVPVAVDKGEAVRVLSFYMDDGANAQSQRRGLLIKRYNG